MALTLLVCGDKALTPIPRQPEIAPADRLIAAENESLRAQLHRVRGDNAKLEAENATLKINVEHLMKVAVFPPRPTVAADAPDAIPPQNVPTMPVPAELPGRELK